MEHKAQVIFKDKSTTHYETFTFIGKASGYIYLYDNTNLDTHIVPIDENILMITPVR